MKVIIIVALIFCAYMIGYWIGYRDCFKYLREKLKEHKNAKEM